MPPLTALPYKKPSTFHFGPSSPPDTNVGPAGSDGVAHRIMTNTLNTNISEHGQGELNSFNGSPDTPTSRFRRGTSIGYHNSGLREARERGHVVAPKSLIIVVPPPSVIQEHGHLGHTLSSGPSHRLSQGLVMPLFPTMYGQLTAISREFNFPSTTGLCLYYHHTENGITMTPRISDDVWPVVWSFSLDSRNGERKAPISGKLEFDIDLSHARWFASWLSSRHREYVDISLHRTPSTAPPTLHFRGDSRATLAECVTEDDYEEGPPTTQRNPLGARHVPRKLSLVERFDVSTDGSEIKPISPTLSPPVRLPASFRALSPITQQEEPKSARIKLDNRVKSWRASAITSPTRLRNTDQLNLERFEPVKLPNNLSISTVDSPPRTAEGERLINLEDYVWSVSSDGPDDLSPLAAGSSIYVPSIHLCSRLNGSVCSTPSYCTSPEPSMASFSPVSLTFPLPSSPDIAHRMNEDSPPTPSTATTWGPPGSYPPSPLGEPYTQSLDLGIRSLFSQPSTPSTTTSWGPQSVDWLPSPLVDYTPPSVHLAHRGECSRPVTPQTSTTWGAPSYPNSPRSPTRLPTPDIGHRSYEDSASIVVNQWRRRPWRHAWPYNRPAVGNSRYLTNGLPADTSPHWSRVQIAFHRRKELSTANVDSEKTIFFSHAHYPHITIYPAVYPHFALYPPVANSDGRSTPPVTSQGSSPHTSFKLLYPYDIYPRTVSELVKPDIPNDVPANHTFTPVKYPEIIVYPDVYPYNLARIYPSSLTGFGTHVSGKTPQISGSNRLAPSLIETRGYPQFTLYPPVYPYTVAHIYPPIYTLENRFTLGTRSSGSHPLFIKISVIAQYPVFELYPATYPYNLRTIYSPTPTAVPSDETMKPVNQPPALKIQYSIFKGIKSQYPDFDIYPALDTPNPNIAASLQYPFFNLYPAMEEKEVPLLLDSDVRISENSYPIFNIYPAVYPFFNLYPTLQIGSYRLNCMVTPAFGSNFTHGNIVEDEHRRVLSELRAQYPTFVIYPPVYPFFELYSPAAGSASETCQSTPRKQESSQHLPSVATRTTPQYPWFEIYPSVYPHFNLWPSIYRPGVISDPPLPHRLLKSPPRVGSASRLTHSELHAMVMMESVNTSGKFKEFALGDDDDTLNLPLPNFSPRLMVSIPHLPSSSSNTLRLSSPLESSPLMTVSVGEIRRKSSFKSHQLSGNGFPENRNSLQSANPKRISMSLRHSVLQSDSPTASRAPSLAKPPRRRDSIVSQRIKAFSFGEPQISPTAEETIFQFPLPPSPQHPPRRLNRIKHPYL